MILKRDEDGNPIEIAGYKSFNVDATNCHGKKFEEGKSYHCKGVIKFGPFGNGYHFAEAIEDTIRYSDLESDTILRNVLIAKVIGRGELDEGEDEYNGYHNMYAASDIEIVKFLTREEVIKYALTLRDKQLEKFLSLYRLNPEELALFRGICYMGDKAIEYRYPEEEKDPNYKTYKIGKKGY